MKYLLPVLAVFLFAACTKTKGVMETTYDPPPTAPIPPEKYCFEYKFGNNPEATHIELILEGDSAHGRIDYPKNAKIADGEFKGVIFGTTVLVNYKFKTDSGLITQEQEWKLEGDSLLQINAKQKPDIQSQLISQSYFSRALYKVACK